MSTYAAISPVAPLRRDLQAVTHGPASPARRHSRLRLTRRGRLLLTATFVFLATVGSAAAGNAVLAADHTDGPVARYVTVAPGETLWQLARDARPDADPRDTVARIQRINGMHGAGLRAGQVLALPAR